MAEKYGTVPKKFTSAWWEYFWDYYKWHTIATVFVAGCIGITAYQCATREVYDTSVTYGGKLVFDTESTTRLELAFEENTSDADKNGEVNVFFMPCSINNEDQANAEYNMAVMTKLDLSLQDETSYLFIYDKAQLDAQIARETFTEAFVPVDEWVKNPDAQNIINWENSDFAYCLKDSKILNDAGVKCDDMYAVLKGCYSDKPEALASFESAKELALAISQ